MALLMKKADDLSVSVIVPFYNSEEYIDKCLDSIINGTKISFEIICVDDGSTDRSVEIVEKFCKTNNAVRLISLPKNEGLYIARLQGAKAAKGKYIGFADSDDYVSPLFFDKLYRAAEKHNSDIAVGQVVNVDRNGTRYVQTRCAKFPYLNGEKRCELYDMFWRQCGRCYHWHVVWNKLYRRELWEKAMPILEKQTEHMVMLEDFIFSSVVLASAKRYSVNTSARYFYIAHPNTSISMKSGEDKLLSNILSMIRAFNFVENFLTCDKALTKYLPFFEQWKQRYGRYWKRNIENSDISKSGKEKCLYSLLEMTGKEIDMVNDEDEFYYTKAIFLR